MELLIVIAIIGILAAITVVAYGGIQGQSNDTSVKNDLLRMQSTLEIWKSNHGGYPDPGVATNNLQDVGIKATKTSYAVDPTTSSNILYCFVSTNLTASYAVMVLSKSGKAFYISSVKDGVQDFTGAWGGNVCTSIEGGFTNNWRGYAFDDVVNGPWRAWIGE